ncbi:hypothetical protein EPUS_01599 [Endocarpon pusillum Z07020]|uniref:DUF676 domain-containing protein n=1 Tax=Endocarpon pusillum (strain Z07020 / HMAS-L-300199) TaxID=1263415 RepID=U1I1H8_ENDPU|nr:uncharacterized protein EPUS_01599 [Endocarpon pusillum Z07020]ERF75769.1 hypothetical protein EPUS_01599 [Endocarpon pusillum Z07020]
MDGFNRPSDSTPLPYTASPLQLLLSELYLIKDILFNFPASIPGVLQPFWSVNAEDELCLLNAKNVRSLLLHVILLIGQPLFLLALVYGLIIPIPASLYLGGIAITLVLNYYFCLLLNGDGTPQTSTIDLTRYRSENPDQKDHDHSDECWIFINGVSVGRDWFQSNLNTLSQIFRRRIIGVHNITYGIIFDLIECLIQRDACYATTDVRTGYHQVKKSLLEEKNKKVVLLLHSQGGIEGGAILDWLLDDLPASVLGKLEIYTFASAANHWNNPNRHHHNSKEDEEAEKKLGVIRHVEHYTNSGDFVSRFGILGFIHLPLKNTIAGTTTKGVGNGRADDNNRFRGKLFKRNATGHMLSQHYLAYMFPREEYTLPDGTVGVRVKENNGFMDSEAEVWDGERDKQHLGWRDWPWGVKLGWWGFELGKAKQWESMMREDGLDLSGRTGEGPEDRKVARKPRELSRLWLYRNGMSPPDDGADGEQRDQHRQGKVAKSVVNGYVNGL